MSSMKEARRVWTDEDEARLQLAIANDPDAAEATQEQLAAARPFREVFPDLYASIQRARGRPAAENPKKQVTIRLDADLLAKLRDSGPGWQSRINDSLRKQFGI